MDSITHSLYKAIAAADTAQRVDAQPRHTLDVAVPGDGGGAGLQPLASRPQAHAVYPEAAGTDLHIELTGHAPELLALWFELTCAGLAPPAGLVAEGAAVILSPGRADVYAVEDDGRGTWVGSLSIGAEGRRAEWREETV